MASELYEQIRREGMRLYGFGPEVMKDIKVCSKCGTASPVSHFRCGKCRAFLPRTTLFQTYKSRHTFCKKCDTVVPDGTKFCPACGAKI